MATIKLSVFKGMRPRTAPKLIDATEAVTALNVDLGSGRLEPMLGPTQLASLGAGPFSSLYRHPVLGYLPFTATTEVAEAAVAGAGGLIFYTAEGQIPQMRSASLTARPLGAPRPAAALTIELLGTPGSDVARSSSYVYTYVLDLGEHGEQESAPSPPTGVVDVYDGQTVQLTGFAAPSVVGVTPTKFRIYRTISGNSSTEWYFVGELLSSLTSYEDDTADEDMSSETMQTDTWDMAPATGRGVIQADNGIYAMFTGRSVYLSEPYIPYAYPEQYMLDVADDIVALGHFSGCIVVATKGRPYLMTGSTPEAMQLTHLQADQACVAARTLCSVPGGVMYASPDGLFLIASDDEGPRLLTSGVLTREQWRALGDFDTAFAAYHDGAYYLFFSDPASGVRFEIGTEELTAFALPGVDLYDAAVDALEDRVYLLADTGSGFVALAFDDGQGDPLGMLWRSKDFYTSVLMSPTALRVVGGQDAENPVTCSLYAEGELAFEALVTGQEVLRVPQLRSERTWAISVAGAVAVDEVALSTSVEELENGI